jgi:hypothetical protein
MQPIPIEGSKLILAFQGLFSKKVFEPVKVLLVGTLLAVGRRTVCSALRFTGLSGERHFHKYHRVLSRVQWSSLKAAKLLLHLLIKCFYSSCEELVLGIDETIERRSGAKIKAKGIYRGPVQSSHSHFVKCSGLRWISMMLLCDLPGAGRIWALPLLTALAASERYCKTHNKRHKKLTDWARQMIVQPRRWLPQRLLIVVADSSYAALQLIYSIKDKVCFISRLRLDAALYNAVPPRQVGKAGRNRPKGARQPTLKQRLVDCCTPWKTIAIPQWYGEKNKEIKVSTATAIWYHSGMTPVLIKWVLVKDPQGKKEPLALLCTNTGLGEEEIITCFIRRWSMEATFQEVRTHLGVEPQRQWSEQAIRRTTPSLMALFSITTLWADNLHKNQSLNWQHTARYNKKYPTFADALAAVRTQPWQQKHFCIPAENNEIIKIPKQLLNDWTTLMAYAA